VIYRVCFWGLFRILYNDRIPSDNFLVCTTLANIVRHPQCIGTTGFASAQRLLTMTMHERQHVAPEIEEHENIKDYRPFAIQTTSLIALIILTSCLITLLEVLRHVLPTRPPDSITYVIGNGYPWTITTAPAVIYACLWLAVDYNVMRMEPFYQFAEPQEDRTGLNDSLTFSYITCNALTIPLYALKRKQWAVFYSSLSHLVASIALPIVVTEMVGFEFDDRLPIARVRFYPTYYRITIGLLATVVILTGALIKTLWSRRSGVKADPSSIVGLAITFAGTDSLAGLRLLKAQTPPQSANLHLFHSRHINETIDVEFHNQGSKIVAQQPLLAQAACSSNPESKLDLTELAVEDDPSPSPLSSMITNLKNSAGLIILPLLLLAIVITLSGSETRVMNDWLVNPDHIVQPVLILISTLIKSLWTTIERGKSENTLKLSTNNYSHKHQ
jgi:hypothetical protein